MPDVCPKCGGRVEQVLSDYPPMPEVDWRCVHAGWACDKITSLKATLVRVREEATIAHGETEGLPRASMALILGLVGTALTKRP